MLLKYVKTSGTGAGSSSSNSTALVTRVTGMRMTMSTASTMTARIHRKGFRIPSKRHPGKAIPSKLHAMNRTIGGKLVPGKRIPQRQHTQHCDNSNDSGLGFDQHVDQASNANSSSNNSSNNNINYNNSSTSTNFNATSTTSTSSAAAALVAAATAGTIPNTSPNSSATVQCLQGKHQAHQQLLQQQQQQQQSENHQRQFQQQQQNHLSSGSSSAGSSSLHHSPQQHYIRAIPMSRSTPAKKLPFYDFDETQDEEDEEFEFLSNDDSDANTSNSTSYGHRGQKAIKRKIIESHVDLDNDDACSEDAFIRKIASENFQATSPLIQQQLILQNPSTSSATAIIPSQGQKFMPGKRALRVASKRQPMTPQNSIASSQNGQVHLEILSQPEQQHRARYQTEGSRGAVKDRSGNGFPIVRLIGYNKPAVLQVFIGTDIGRVAPHMFYQACKVAGKNSTQCNEKKVEGTMVIEIDFKPESEMTITCDCVGILKERNVDVEHRFPDHLAQKNKKKSTRCRMVFRTELTHDDGSTETLQVCSNPIICTQPPGVPEICKKSLDSCPVDGGLELFIIGKNFLKDTQVLFQEIFDGANDSNSNDMSLQSHNILNENTLWQQAVSPDKEYLQQTHLICTVPPYMHQNIMKPITVQVSIVSSGKRSESHSFIYTPKGSYSKLAAATALSSTFNNSPAGLSAAQDASTFMDASSLVVNPQAPPSAGPQAQNGGLWPTSGSAAGVVNETKHEIDADMMPPPITNQMPLGVRRPSLNNAGPQPMITDQQLAHLNAVAAEALKTELLDENSQSSMAEALHSPETNAVNVCSPHSPNALQYHSRYGRKASLDAMMYESNSLPGYPVATATAAAASAAPTSIEVAAVAAAIEKGLLHAAVVQQQHQQQQEQQVASALAAAKVDKFITDLAKEAVVSATTPVSDTSLFEVPPNVNVNVNASNVAFDQAITEMLVNQQQPQTCLERSLSISSNSSSSNSSSVSPPLSALSGSNSSPANSLTSHSSPHAQDVLLNSETAVSLTNSLPMQQILSNPSPEMNVATTSATTGIVPNPNTLTTDMIMNSSVSPSSILCNSPVSDRSIVPNMMASHPVGINNFNDIAMQPQASQATQQEVAVAALAISNIINGANDVLPSNSSVVQPEVSQATSTAVNNIIMNAAAAFLTSQQKQHQDLHQHQQQQLQQQHLQQQHQLQQQQQQHLQHQQHQLQQQHQALLSHHAALSSQQPQAQQQQMTSSAAGNVPTNTDTLVNLLLSHSPVQTSANAANPSVGVSDVVSSPFGLGLPPTTQSESLIVALAAENALQKSVVNGATASVPPATTPGAILSAANVAAAVTNAVVGGVGAVTPLPPAIPQELTTMSDQDLISYINPSAFDQV